MKDEKRKQAHVDSYLCACFLISFSFSLFYNRCISFFLYGCHDLFVGQFGFVILDDHFESVITGVDLLHPFEGIFKRLQFHGTVGTGHIFNFEGFLEHWRSLSFLFKHDLPCIHAHGAGKEEGAALLLRGNVDLGCACFWEELIVIQRWDDKIAGAGIGLIGDEVEGKFLACGGFQGR